MLYISSITKCSSNKSGVDVMVIKAFKRSANSAYIYISDLGLLAIYCYLNHLCQQGTQE